MIRKILTKIAALTAMSLAMHSPTLVADSAMQDILASKQLKVCAWAPYGGITSKHKDGTWSGLDIDMAYQLASSLGAAPTIVDSNFGSFADQLASGECHVAMFGIGRTLPRAQKVAFSEPYLASGLHAVVNSDKHAISSWQQLDVAGNSIAVTKNTFVEAFMGQYLKNATMLPISPPEWAGALESGQATALVTDFVFATKLKQGSSWAKVVSPDQPLSQTTYGYAVSPENQRLLGYVNLFLSEAKRQGVLADFAAKHDLTEILY